MADHPLRPATDRALVGLYPTNQLIRYRPLKQRKAKWSPAFFLRKYAVLANLSISYPPLLGTFRYITHPFATRHPRSKLLCAAVRLACVKHAASVQSEPGSNSYVQSLTYSTSGPLQRNQQETNVCLCLFLSQCGARAPTLIGNRFVKELCAEAAKTRTIREWGFQVKHCSGDISGENGIALAEKEILFWKKRAKAGERL